MERLKVSKYCDTCKKRIAKKQKRKSNSKYCLKCYKRHIEIQEINHFIDVMNNNYQTNVRKFEIVDLDNLI